MGRIDFNVMRHLDPIHYRVLTAVEMGMKNHEVVPLDLIVYIVKTHRGAVNKALKELCKKSVVAHEKGRRFEGYRLTYQGYDFLALNTLQSRGIVGFISTKIGVGKESEVFLAADANQEVLVVKLHRLGRTFQKLKEKRDYLCKRRSCSWLYLARLAAKKEYAFQEALHKNGFRVPRPIDFNRNTVVMEYIEGDILTDVHQLNEPEVLYDRLMSLILELGGCGLIHGDFNEFNIMITKDETPVLIDFPQMISIDHENAEFYFDRDVQCIRTFFIKRFNFESELHPEFGDIERTRSLDVDLRASGFIKTKDDDDDSEQSSAEEQVDFEENKNEAVEKNAENECDSRKAEDVANQSRQNKRLANWIEDAQNRLNTFTFDQETVDADCSSQYSDNHVMQPEPEVSTNFDENDVLPECCIGKNKEAEVLNETSSVNDDDNCNERRSSNVTRGKTVTIVSSVTSVAPEVINRRVTSELRNRRAKNKKALYAKGRSSLTDQRRKSNMSLIREYDGWEE